MSNVIKHANEAVEYLQRVIFDDVNWCNKVRHSWQVLKSTIGAYEKRVKELEAELKAREEPTCPSNS